MKGLDELFTSKQSLCEVNNNSGSQRAVNDPIGGNHSRRATVRQRLQSRVWLAMSGDIGCPRASAGNAICTSAYFKGKYHEKRQRQAPGAPAKVPAAVPRKTEVMPAGLEVHEVAGILGEGRCTLQGLPDAVCRSGPRYPLQSYLVRGSFAERVGEPAQDDDPDD
jgi:hypothetical protein